MPFPPDDYTPHGYLDIPSHTRNLHPRGVLRSHAAGLRWHFPAFAGMYGGRRETYRAGFALALDGALALAEFDQATSPYHSKDLLSFELRRGAAMCRATYQLVGEHALHAAIEASGAARLALVAGYERVLAANGEWGESGLVGRLADGMLVLQGFEDGEAFVIWAARPFADIGIATNAAAAQEWAARPAPGLPASGFVPTIGRAGELVGLHAVLGFTPADGPIDVIMARGRTLDAARQHLAAARAQAGAEYTRKRAADAAFWAGAPQLAGDWPAHWRRGLVYDLETLRMMVKQPAGIYKHYWDAMQIQAPRVVLAEAAIDALLLSYADAQLAQALLLGVFLDAPAPNLPCSREDGSYTMVAADGTVCGTAPAWGYPFLVIEWLWRLRPDRAWLMQIYPLLAAYLEWWLAERRDESGALFYACSWESGQDDSPRFGAQPLGGGHPTRHVYPADLHAAMAHACGVMARLAALLGDTYDWGALAGEFADRTRALWNGRRWADFDALAGALTSHDDLMLLAPLALGLADQPQAAALRDALLALDVDAIVWPMSAWTATAAAQAAGLPAQAARIAAAICERAYGFSDARTAQAGRTLPGISCEYWPPNGSGGGEGYGWGAFTMHLLLHTLVGLAPTATALEIRPNLPLAWRVAGRRYCLRLHWHTAKLDIRIEPCDQHRLVLIVNTARHELAWGEAIVL